MAVRSLAQSGLVLTALAFSAVALSSPGQARFSFDGRWRVEAVADPGRCSDRYVVAIRVADGQISGAFFGATAAGNVDANGKLNLYIDVVRANGALAAATGVGRWKSPTCNGSWTARRA
jgi:hypothetical protein